MSYRDNRAARKGVTTDFTKMFEERKPIENQEMDNLELAKELYDIKFQPKGYRGDHKETEPFEGIPKLN